MNIKPKLIITFSFIGILILFSCKKNTEQDIKGTWNRVLVEVHDSTATEQWIFDGDYLKISKYQNDILNEKDSGKYVIRSGISNKFLRTSGFKFQWYNNLDWRIERLKGGQLVLFSDRDNYFLYYEFTKQY